MRLSMLPFLLLAIPALEIAVFIVIGGEIGVLWTVALILLTAVIGSILLRMQGFQVVQELQRASEAGRIPGRELGHGAMILAAGILLLTPGFVTVATGFLLFVPAVREIIWKHLASRITVVAREGFAQGMGGRGDGFADRSRPGRDGVVDLDADEYRDLDGEEDDRRGEAGSSGRSGQGSRQTPWLPPDDPGR